jgi:hypothetical protein
MRMTSYGHTLYTSIKYTSIIELIVVLAVPEGQSEAL